MAQGNTSKGQVITLVVIAVALAIGYVALEVMSRGEQAKATAETRGTQIAQALTKFRLASGKYPDRLDALAPKFLPALPTCAGGEAFSYSVTGNDYTLGCPNTRYDSRTRAWQG